MEDGKSVLEVGDVAVVEGDLGDEWGGGAKLEEEVGVLLEVFGVDDVGVLAAGGPELVIEEIESGCGVDHRVDLDSTSNH